MPFLIPIIIPLIGYVVGGAIGGTILGISSAVIGVAIGSIVAAGISMLIAPGAQKAPPGSRERTQSIRESAAVRKLCAGTVRVGPNCHPIYDTSTDGKLLRMAILASHEIESVEAHYLIGEAVALDGSGAVTGSTDAKWDGNVTIHEFLGASDQAALAEAVTAYGPWTSAHRARGMAGVFISQTPVSAADPRARHLHVTIQYEALIKGAKCYDPRTGLTAWTDNAALVTLWYATHPDGRGHALSRYDLASWSAAADICDEDVALAEGGTEKRYRSNVVVGLDEDPNGVIIALLQNFDASTYLTSAGKLAVQVGDVAPSNYSTLSDRHVLGSEFQAGPRAIDRYNRVVAVMISEAHAYQEITAPAAEDAAHVAANGARTFGMAMPYCPSHTQAQRLAKKKLLRLTPNEVGTISTNLAGLNIRPGQSIRLAYDGAETDDNLRVMQRRIGEDGMRVEFQVQSVSPDYDVWSVDEEKPLAAMPPVSGTGSILTPPAGVVAESYGIVINQETPAAGILVQWTDPEDDTLQVEAEFSLSGSGVWIGRQTIGDASQAYATSPALTDGASYIARVRFLGASGSPTDWTTSAAATATAVSTVLDPPTIEGVRDGGTEIITITGVAPDVAALLSCVVYLNAATDNFATASVLRDVSVLRGDTFTATTPGSGASGTRYFWATSKNVSGIEGAPSATIVSW